MYARRTGATDRRSGSGDTGIATDTAGRERAQVGLAAVIRAQIAVREARRAHSSAGPSGAVGNHLCRTRARETAPTAVARIEARVYAHHRAYGEPRPARDFTRPRVTQLARAARDSAPAAVRAVRQEGDLAAVGRRAVAVAPPGVARAERAHAGRATRTRVRRAADVSAATAVGRVDGERALAAVRSRPVAVAEAGTARVAARRPSAISTRVRRSGARRAARPAGRRVARRVTTDPRAVSQPAAA